MRSDGLKVIDGGDPIRQQAAAWFARLRADDVSESDRRRWQHWLASDDRHRVAYERIERLWSGLGEYAPHPEIEQRLRTHAPAPAARTRTVAPARRRAPFGWLASAAAVVVAFAAGWWMLREAPVPETRYATVVGERRSLELEDGSRVDLDTNTSLRVRYSAGERRITLDRGRAFFRVAKEKRPLRVQTESGSVRAVGTEFEVYRHADAIDVALFEGHVQLLSAAKPDAGPIALAMLSPGQKARFGQRQPQPRIETIAMDAAPAWLSGRLVFEDEPLAVAVAEFNRYSRKPIVLGSDALARLRISGVFRSDDPSAFVEALRGVYAIAASTAPTGEVVLSERH